MEYMFQAMFYMIIGYVFKKGIETKLLSYVNNVTVVVVWIVYLSLVFVPYLLSTEFSILPDIIYSYISSLVGISAVVLIAKKIPSNKYTNFVGQNTLVYFALHGKLYSVIQTVLIRFAGGFYYKILGNTLFSSIFALLFSLLLSVLLIIPAVVINKWFPFILGKKSATKIE